MHVGHGKGRRKRAEPPRSADSILQQLAQVRHNPARERFELFVAGDLVGVLGYQLDLDESPAVMTVLHTVLYEEFSGHGLGQRLTDGALHYVADHGYKVHPVCSYTQRYISTHPGAARLVA